MYIDTEIETHSRLYFLYLSLYVEDSAVIIILLIQYVDIYMHAHISICISMSIDLYISICISVSIDLYIENHKLLLTSPNLHWIHSFFFFSIFMTVMPDSEKPDSYYPQYIYLFDQFLLY